MAGKAADIIEQYQRHAARWDQERPKNLLEKKWLDRFLVLMTDIQPITPHVLDLGCGAGAPMADYLISQQCQMTGVDSAESMIHICQGRWPQQEWIVEDMRKLNITKRFNGILAWNSFFHLSHNDQRKMFRVFNAHAAPGCALMFTSGDEHGEAIGILCEEPLYHASLAREEYQTLLEQNGFEVISHIVEDPECYEHTIWLAQKAG